jgi:(1->4)-alpha-D-glucan 1-alpha-D-glucosylmutase
LRPRCTYRLQLSRDFPFEAAGACSDYLASLGITHLYCSPFLQAAAGTTHGYDVVDPTRIDAALGGEAGFRSLIAALKSRGLEVLMDIVPNHMATAGRANRWWWDILEHGRESHYASYFDIDWEPAMSSLKGKVLLGILADRYGRELEAGRITLQRDDGGLVIRYHDEVFPVAPESLGGAPGAQGEEVERMAGDAGALDTLLQRQHYRLAFWRTAQEELNYRRFFTVDTLIGLRVELEEVMEESHRLALRLVEDGSVAGLRVDHLDGLRDPQEYLERLRRGAPRAYIVVEKVLDYDEQLPAEFPVQGTTGYDFIAHVDGLFVDAGNEEPMTALYHAFTGESLSFAEVARAAKQETMVSELAPDLERLTSLLVEICERHWMHRDRTRRELQESIRELATALTVYRTYVRPGAASADDLARIAAAVQEAARRQPAIDPELLAFTGELLAMKHAGGLETEFAARFQQFTPAVMAKGVEDTAFYRYNRMVALNEVGGDPARFGRPVESFHEFCSRLAAGRPATMLTLATHDTKRSADVRARLSLLSEIPADWDAAVRRWAEHNERHRSQGYPDRSLEYLIYQTLVGTWPIDLERLMRFLQKAMREAGVHTSWVNPVAAYEEAVARFAGDVMADAEFLGDLQTFIGKHQLVSLGRIGSLAQTTLLLTCPGVPDLYQGSETWDLSLVDPDNRRPVDYGRLRALLAEARGLDAAQALARGDEGVPKLWLIARLLEERRRDPGLFESQSYSPIPAVGTRAHHAVAFVRDRLLVVVPRLLAGLKGDWADTSIEMPGGRWSDLLSGGPALDGSTVALNSLLRDFPVAVLHRA